MYKLSTESLKPGMVLYDDIYSPENELILKANKRLTETDIHLLHKYSFTEVELSEPKEVDMTHYEHLHASEHFKRFNDMYEISINSFGNLMRNLGGGLEINIPRLLSLRDDILLSVMNDEQLIDYLYNMVPNENEITLNHCFNCGLLCYIFGKWSGIEGDDLDNITISGFLFDIGKTKISDELLWKPDKLTPEEFIQMQHHIHMGYELVRTKTLPPHVISVMIMHHERCDGSGYPARIQKDRIDPFALIAAIADTYEAMTHPRAQRPALTPFQAFREFENQGFEKYGDNINLILTRIANMYIDRRVCVTGNIEGRIIEIHEEDLSHPTIFASNVEYDLRTRPNAEIIRMI